MKLLVLLLLASCAPDPFGTDCRTSPSCQKREDKKRRAAQTDRAETCKASNRMWLDNERSTMPCDSAKHACSGTLGCPANTTCVNDSFCIEGEPWAGYCGVCGDRALMTSQRAQEEADLLRREKLTADARAVAEGEIKTNKCTDASKMETAIDGVEKDWKHAGALHKRGTIVATQAGVRVDADAVPGARYTLTAGGFEKVLFDTKDGLDLHSGSWDDQRYAWARESQVATGATITWTVKGTGCVAWILVRDK
jgi:hypothetical protein